MFQKHARSLFSLMLAVVLTIGALPFDALTVSAAEASRSTEARPIASSAEQLNRSMETGETPIWVDPQATEVPVVNYDYIPTVNPEIHTLQSYTGSAPPSIGYRQPNTDESYYPSEINSGAITFYGADGNFGGWVSFTENNPSNTSYVAGTGDFMVWAGEYVDEDGYVYGMLFDGSIWPTYRYFKAPLSNLSDQTTIAFGGIYIVDMAYNYSTGRMYCICQIFTGSPFFFYEIDLNDFSFREISEFQIFPLTLTITTDGTAYCVDWSNNAKFYEVDLETGDLSLIGPTGFPTGLYAQTMTYDHNTNRIFWAQCSDDLMTLIEINPYTGQGTNLGSLGPMTEYAALFIKPEFTPEINHTTVNITAPVVDRLPQDIVDSGLGYTASIRWNPVDSRFKEYTVYTATVTLTATGDHYFSSGFTTTVPGYSISNLINNTYSVSFDVVFPQTDAMPATAEVTLTVVGDPWGDGGGFVLMLDPKATAKGSINPYKYDYFIPEEFFNNHGLTVVDYSETIDVPVGVCDIFCSSMWDGNWYRPYFIYNDFIIEAGSTYEFIVSDDGDLPFIKLLVNGIEIIESMAITMPSPAGGAVPQLYVENDYATGTITWEPNPGGTFGYETVYTANINFTAKPGYTLEKCVAVIIPGATVSGIEFRDGALKLKAAFPATKPEGYIPDFYAFEVQPVRNYFSFDIPKTTQLVRDYILTNIDYRVYSAEYIPETETVFFFDRDTDGFYSYPLNNPTDITAIATSKDYNFVDLSYDYSTGTLFGLGTDLNGKKHICIIDPVTGRFTDSAILTDTVGETMLTFAINSEGEAYMIASAAEGSAPLYRVDLYTGELTYIGGTGYRCFYVQSMAFNHDDGLLYWAECSDYTPVLLRVNVETAQATYLATTDTEISALINVPKNGIEPPIPEGPVFQASADPEQVNKGESFNISTEFSEEVTSSFVMIKFEFDDSMFEFVSYTADAGLTQLGPVLIAAGSADVALMPSSGNVKDFGYMTFKAKDDADPGTGVINVVITLEDESQESASVTVTIMEGTGVPGDTTGKGYVSIIDVSNMADWIGKNSLDPEWEAKYKSFDFDGNGEISLNDVIHVAKLIQ